MRVADMNWEMVERYLSHDDRCLLPLGATEQHSHLSLCVDALLAERVSVEAAEPLGVPVFPAVPYGPTPYFTAFPGTVSIRVETLLALVRDIIRSLRRTGFRRILIVNGHGGNDPAGVLAHELMADMPDMQIRFHSWYAAPETSAAALKIDSFPSHANWFENFPWTRLPNHPRVEGEKPVVDRARLGGATPERIREILRDGSYGGAFCQSDEHMLALWTAGVEEVRAAIQGPWAAR